MNRRNFFETLAAVPASTTLAAGQVQDEAGRGRREGRGTVLDPSASSPRIRENFNRGWKFARQAKGTGALGSFDRQNGEAAQIEPRFREAHLREYDDGDWAELNLPHTWNAFDTMDESPGYWRGIGWYRKHFKLANEYSGRAVFLEFEGASSVAEFWLNGQRIGEHQGGYTSFEWDVSDHVQYGEAENVLTVRVDNLFRATLPPTVKTDFTFYGGIYRDVWLRISARTYIADVFWSTPNVSDQSAELRLESCLVNQGPEEASLTLVHELIGPEGSPVNCMSLPVRIPAGGSRRLTQDGWTVSNPKLWSPDSPHLYRVRSSLRGTTREIDVLEIPLGFRWFKFDAQRGFLLNGRRVQLQGTNWHQMYPGMGTALPNSRHAKDMEIIRAMGVNFWRTSHYPHDPATMEASDRLGLMVWEELPILKEIGDTQEYIANCLTMAKAMIRRDRNHPSVIVWGIAGELNASAAVANAVIAAVSNRYRQLDPSRPVGMHEPRGEEIEALVDVVGSGVGKETDEKHRRFPARPYLTAEYAAATMGRGLYGGGPETEDLACAKHEEYLRQLNSRPWMAGGAIWHQFDYEGETYDTVLPHVVSFGMCDLWRIPKDAYYFYQSQWTAAPMVHIVGHWTWQSGERQARSVKVYSNAYEVELFLNGKSLGSKVSGNEEGGLAHPPRIWTVAYQPGILRAVARQGGREVSDERQTAGPPHHLEIHADVRALESGNLESLAYLTVRVVDEKGTLVPWAEFPITFTCAGPGELLPQTWLGHGTGWTLDSIAGMAQMAFRATGRTGHATISAYAPGLQMGRVEISVQAEGAPDEMEYREKF